MNKNLFLFAAAAALTFTACSDNDDMTASRDGSLSSNETTAVQFSTYLAGQQTRATVGSKDAINTEKLGTTGFGVMAYSTGSSVWAHNTVPNFMYNQKVALKSGSPTDWTYEPIKYWPNDFSTGNVDDKQGESGESYNATGSKTTDGKVSFFAYAPWVDVANSDYTAEGTDVPTDVKFAGTAYGTGKYVFASDGTSTASTDLKTDDGIIALTTNATKNDPIVRYGLTSTKYSEDVDLLWGLAGKSAYSLADAGTQTKKSGTDYNTDLTKQAANEKIAFLFKHALAKLGGNTDNNTNTTSTETNTSKVKVVLDLDNGETDASTKISGGSGDFSGNHTTLVTVKSITIQDWKSYLNDNPDNPYKDTEAKKYRKYGWFNLATGVWSDVTDDDKADITANGAGSYKAEITTDGGTGDNQYKLDADIAEPTSATNLTYDATNKWQNGTTAIEGVIPSKNKDVYAKAASETDKNADEGIVMIPGGDAMQFVVTVEYVVRTYDKQLAKYSDGTNTEGTWSKSTQKITNLVEIPGDAVASNKVYSLLIHLGLTSVKFTAQVDAWEDATDSNDPDNPTPGGNGSTTDNKDIYLPSNTLYTSTTQSQEITADATTASIELTGLTEGYTVSVAEVKKDGSVITTVTGSDATVGSDGKATISLTNIEANESTDNTVVYTVTLNVKNKDSKKVQTTIVTITQAKKTA